MGGEFCASLGSPHPKNCSSPRGLAQPLKKYEGSMQQSHGGSERRLISRRSGFMVQPSFGMFTSINLLPLLLRLS